MERDTILGRRLACGVCNGVGHHSLFVSAIPGPGIITFQLWKELSKGKPGEETKKEMVAHTSVGLFSCTKGKMVEQWYKLTKNDKKQKEKETTAEIRIALFHIVWRLPLYNLTDP